jgi:hypothetical protein
MTYSLTEMYILHYLGNHAMKVGEDCYKFLLLMLTVGGRLLDLPLHVGFYLYSFLLKCSFSSNSRHKNFLSFAAMKTAEPLL